MNAATSRKAHEGFFLGRRGVPDLILDDSDALRDRPRGHASMVEDPLSGLPETLGQGSPIAVLNGIEGEGTGPRPLEHCTLC